MLKQCAAIWDELKRTKPLVHCITNYVTVNDVANIILACGGSPAMVEHPDEAGPFASLAHCLYLNLGTLNSEQEMAMLAAAQTAGQKDIPLVIDPVAYGVVARKAEVINKLRSASRFTAVKGNSAEIKSLAGMEAMARGVDSLDSGEGITDACQFLSVRDNNVVIATGEIDVIADKTRTACVENGTHLFSTITGAGCMVGGVVAACIGTAPSEAWLASISAVCAFNLAGERAARISGENPGTFRSLLFDQLYHLTAEDIVKEARINC